MSTPHALRAAGSIAVNGAVPPKGVFAVQKLAANGSSVSLPPTTHWFVRFFRCEAKLCIEKCAPSGFDDGRMKMSRLSTRSRVRRSSA